MKKMVMLFLTICAFGQSICSDINWASPTTISTANSTGSDPKVIIDVNGNATAVWVEDNFIKASSLPLNGSWSTPTTLSGMGGSLPQIGMDSSGNVTAIWLENGVVTTARLPFNGSWSAATAVSNSGASSPALDVDNSGNAVAVWVRGGFIESSTQLFGGSWGLVAQLTTDTSSHPKVAIGEDGTVVAVWHSIISGADTVVSATSPINGSWNAANGVLTISSSFSHHFPKITVDANGNATAIWLRYHFDNIYQNISILASTLNAGASSWSSPTVLTSGGEILDISKISTELDVDGNGNVVAFWSMSYDGSSYNVETATKPIGSDWSLLITLQANALYPYLVDVRANNSLGNALGIYMIFDGTSSVIIQTQEANIVAPGSTDWSQPITISQGSENAYPDVSVSINGQTVNAAAVWIDFDGMNNKIAASVGSKTVISPPTDLSAMQSSNNFGVFVEYFNTVTWTPSVSPNIAQYNIYRDGVYFNSVDFFTSEIIDHNAVQNGSVTYGVSAEDSSGTVSPIATVVFP